MIKIDNEYVINSNENCYSLERISKVKDINSKNYGKEIRVTEGYYTKIEDVLKGYMKAKTRKYISRENENSLKELLNEIKEMDNYLKENLGIYIKI